MDLSRVPFSWDDRPLTISWIDELDGPLAIQQCAAWNILPAETLEQNKVILKRHMSGALSRLDYTNAPNVPNTRAMSYTRNADNAPNLDLETPPSTPSNNLTPHREWLHIIQATAEAVGTQIAAALRTNQPLITTNNNGNLPRVLLDMVDELPVCSGGEAHKLLDFLIGCHKLLDLELADNRQLLIALLPKTSGQVRTQWVEAISQNTVVSQVCQDVVGLFLPDRAKQQLITETIFRMQEPQESLSEFITSIQDAARVLFPEGGDLLDTILTGINANTRARLAGFRAPESVEQLLQLVPHTEVIRAVERRAQEETRARTSQQFSAHIRRDWHRRTPPHRQTYYNSNPHTHTHSRDPALPHYTGTPHYRYQPRHDTYRDNNNRTSRQYNSRQFTPTVSPRHTEPQHYNGAQRNDVERTQRRNQYLSPSYNNGGRLNDGRGR